MATLPKNLRLEEADFCRYCGAGIPPRLGEGTCEKCDPEGVKNNDKKNKEYGGDYSSGYSPGRGERHEDR